jgi:chemotaxis methyl-accepting protein methylase
MTDAAPPDDPKAPSTPEPKAAAGSGDAPPEEPGDRGAGGFPPSPRAKPSFPIAGIGASAGGLEALEDLTKELSGDRMAFVMPTEIGKELMRVGGHPYVDRVRPQRLVDTPATANIYWQLRESHGIDFSQYKQSFIERRIARRMALHKVDKVNDYAALLGTEDAELRCLCKDLLIGVTSFFRDGEPFEALKNVVFPRLVEGRSTDIPIRVWVAGCSTGEEAYSVAIALLEFLGERAGAYRIQIFATDIDDDALARARAAVYPTNIDLDVSPGHLQRFFVRTDRGYQVSRQVRDLVVFARHNLGKEPPFSRLDLVTCRNVLIYMQTPLQKKVLRIIHYTLNPDAYVLVGTSESVGHSPDLFSLIDRKLKIYVRKNTPAAAVFELSLARRSPLAEEAGVLAEDHRRPMLSVAQQVLSALPQPVMLINRQQQIVWANRALLETFSHGPSVLGRPLSEVWGNPTDPAEFWVFLEELASGRTPRDVLIEHPFGRTAEHPMRFSGRVVSTDEDRPWLGLVSMHEV